VNELPDQLTDFGINTVGPSAVPWTIVPFVILAPVFAVVLHYTALDRRIYAIGGNPDVALYTGVRVRLIRFGLFVVSGLMCALAGIVFTARLSNARADNAVGCELDVITITLLGGISVFGGRGNLIGVLWALGLVAIIRNVLGLNRVGGDGQGVAIGLLLILSLCPRQNKRQEGRDFCCRSAWQLYHWRKRRGYSWPRGDRYAGERRSV
jgi:rhamnose transport system permease protein